MLDERGVMVVDHAKRHFQHYFSYILAVSFIDGENRRKLPTCTNFIMGIKKQTKTKTKIKTKTKTKTNRNKSKQNKM